MRELTKTAGRHLDKLQGKIDAGKLSPSALKSVAESTALLQQLSTKAELSPDHVVQIGLINADLQTKSQQLQFMRADGSIFDVKVNVKTFRDGQEIRGLQVFKQLDIYKGSDAGIWPSASYHLLKTRSRREDI